MALGNDVLDKLVKGEGDLAFFDARPSGDGSRKASDIFAGSSDKTLAELTAHDNAQVLRNRAGEISNDIVLGATFFSALNLRLEGLTLVHEALHAVLKMNDNDIASKLGVTGGSVGIQVFLNSNCQKQ